MITPLDNNLISPIDYITPIRPAAGEPIDVDKLYPDRGSFSEIFRQAIEYVRQTDDEKTKAEYLLSTGQLDNPAELTIAATKNQIAVDLLVQLRNKALDAYSELNRISM